MSEATEKKFRKFVRQLGRLIQAEADKGLAVRRPKTKPKTTAKPRAKATKWVSAFVDVRWFADAEGFTAKFRVALPDDKRHSIQTSMDMGDLFHKLSSVRKEEPTADWYGLKVIVTFDGEVTTELDRDPNCVVDPTWFKS